MNLTNNDARNVRLAGYTVIVLLLYAALFFMDVITDGYLRSIDGREALSIENKRACEEDYPQIEEARRLGYKSLVYPDLFDQESWKPLAEKYRIAPLGPNPNLDIYFCNEGYGQVRYKSDRYGFRNPDSLWDLPTIDVLLIGDSYVQGACVGENQNISGVLNAAGLKTLNLGTGSNSPIHYAALAKTFGPIKTVKNMVIVFYANDNIENEENSVFNKYFFQKPSGYFKIADRKKSRTPELSENLQALYGDALAKLDALSGDMDKTRTEAARQCAKSNLQLDSLRDWAKAHLILRNLRTLLRFAVFSRNVSTQQTYLPYGSKLAIDVLKNECAANKCNPIVVYIPNSSFWRPDARAGHYSELLKQYAAEQRISFIDLTPELEKIGMSAYGTRGPHLSPEGYKIVANTIRTHLH